MEIPAEFLRNSYSHIHICICIGFPMNELLGEVIKAWTNQESRLISTSTMKVKVLKLPLLLVLVVAMMGGAGGQRPPRPPRQGGPSIVTYDFVVKYFTGAPDGVPKRILGVNNRFPGPTIRARIGDTLVVRVRNMIQTRENTSIHWHGIEQVLTPFEDGPEMITQCPIVYGATQVYSFKLQQSGTYWWHSHHAWQYIDGYWGLLIVDNEPEVHRGSYDGEIVIALNDWYHKGGQELSDWYLSPASQGHEPIPDSVLLNGRGSYNCSLAAAKGLDCSQAIQANRRPVVFTVERYKTYRIRVINTSAMTPISFSIDGHKLETIEVDGVDTVRVGPVDTARLSAAMRYSFLVTMNAPVSRRNDGFWIRATAFTVPFQPNPNINPFPDKFEPEVKAILRYSRSSIDGPPGSMPTSGLGPDLDIDIDGPPVLPMPAGGRPIGIIPPEGESEGEGGFGLAGESVHRPPPLPVDLAPVPKPPVPARQGRPETHGINWSNLTQVLNLIENQNVLENKAIRRTFSLQSPPGSNESATRVRREAVISDEVIGQSAQPPPPPPLGTRPDPFRPPPPWLPITPPPFPTSQANTPAVSLNPNHCRPYPGNKLAPASYDEQITINVDFVTDSDGVVRGKMNNMTYKIGSKPVIFQMLADEPIPDYVNPIEISLDKTIQLVINNRGHAGHPFHLHGHTYWVMGSGVDGDLDYNPARDEGKLKRDGVRRDTTTVFPHSWTVIRFRADNPGAWLFHCHINWHLQSGLGAVFIEGAGISRAIYKIPRASANVCRAARIAIS